MTVWMAREAYRAICEYADSFYPLECGGLLLGWRHAADRIIVAVRGPGPRALHGRQCFVPDHASDLAEIENAFRVSNGDVDYLGDWHSHPDGVPELSGLDIQTLRAITRRVNEPLMLIIGQDGGNEWRPESWMGRQSGYPFFRRFDVETQRLELIERKPDWSKSWGKLSFR